MKDNTYRDLFHKWNLENFELYKDYVTQGRVLIVGHGLGSEYDILEKHNKDIVSIDIEISTDALHKEKVLVYPGDTIPFEDSSFDAVVCNYVLHHSDNPERLFSELVRVSKRTVIVTEETHRSLLQKVRSVVHCWYMNRKAGQSVHINWSSYLSVDRLERLIHGLAILKRITEDKGVHVHEFLILEKGQENG